jgi:predicted glutamine amidotransferase
MCRLFGFRSVFSSRVHSSLIGAENSFIKQSEVHGDGWGVAYYIDDVPHILKTTNAASECKLFSRISGVVTSKAVIGHLRKATIGDLDLTNAHPFQYGPWVFAHNGNIKNFSAHKEKLTALVDPSLKQFILGQTDSELLFFILLSELKNHDCLKRGEVCTDQLTSITRSTVSKVTDIIGELYDGDGGPDENYLTFILTNGKVMLAHSGGKDLYYSTHKKSCPDKSDCKFFNETCENPSKKNVNHLIFSSEPLSGTNVWNKLRLGEIVGVDHNLVIFQDLN